MAEIDKITLPEISKITLPDGITYGIKDATARANYTKLLSDIWVGTETDYNAITTKQEGTIYLIDDTTTAGTTTVGTGTVEKMWYGTKNDYDRLSTKDDNVLYLLVEEF